MEISYNKLVAAGLSLEDIREYIMQLLQSANIQNKPRVAEDASDFTVRSNDGFWQLLMSRRTRPLLKWVVLEGFQLTDWYPRTPGVFHTDEARRARYSARDFGRVVDGFAHYLPRGKEDMVHRGGVGSLRFKPVRIEGSDCWLYTATDDSYCHTGIPLAIPQAILEGINFDTNFRVDIVGQIRFLPDFLEHYFYHMTRVPQVYILVDKITKTSKKSGVVKITPTILFRFSSARSNDLDAEYPRRRARRLSDYGVSYVTCYSDGIRGAIDWLEHYVELYGEEILTNFDQQIPQFVGVPFSINNVMTGRISVHELEKFHIHQAEIICDQIQGIHARAVHMSKKIEINVNDSGQLDIKGDLIIADEIKNSFNKASGIPDDKLKELMQEMTVAIGKMSQELSESVQQEVAQDLDILATESAKEQPTKRRWEFSVEGLKKAAQNMGEIGKPVIELAAKIAAILALRSV